MALFWVVFGCMQVLVPPLGIRSRPVRWKHGVLTTGLQGKSVFPVFLNCTIGFEGLLFSCHPKISFSSF